MKKNAFRDMGSFILLIGALLAMAFAATCGGGGDSAPSTGTVNTTISDPPTCKSPGGSFDKVWVTITRVRAHTSNNATPNDSGWIDLIDLRNAPKQIDLLNLDSTTCVLTQLGSTSGLPAGQYQQIRLYLLSNSPGSGEATPSPNNCVDSGSYNCVVLAGATTTETLNLSSEAQTGIKIPSGQIAGGKFTVLGGQSIDLNFDFDACSSIVQQGNGQYRLKPVLHAGEISLNNNSISGRVIENGTINGIPNAMVMIEQMDSENIDRVIMQKMTDSDGKFIFCPLPSGTYDVVVSVKDGTVYTPTITLGVGVGTAMGSIPLFQASGSANISGQVTAQITPAGEEVNIDISALQNANSSLRVTVPVLQGSTPTNVTTQNGIATYNLRVPADTPRVGSFNSGGTSYSPVAGDYLINAQPTTNCTQSSLLTSSLSVAPGENYSAQDLAFTGCTVN